MTTMHLELKEARVRLGLTRTQVSRWARCSDMTVARYELGAKLGGDLPQRFAVVLFALRAFEAALGTDSNALRLVRTSTTIAPSGTTHEHELELADATLDPTVAKALGVEPPPPSSGARFDVERRQDARGNFERWEREGERLVSKDEARAFATGTLRLSPKNEGKTWRIVEVTS